MSAHSSRIKTEHLGEPHGTAQNKLRKMIIFQQAQRFGEDVCFKCGQKISTVEELSIEHKIPWLHGDVSLFWDLDNIAFSHCKCNKTDRLRGKKPQPAPEGQAWCVGCQAFLDIAHFNRSKSTWNGLQKYCRICHRALQRSSLARRVLAAGSNAKSVGNGV